MPAPLNLRFHQPGNAGTQAVAFFAVIANGDVTVDATPGYNVYTFSILDAPPTSAFTRGYGKQSGNSSSWDIGTPDLPGMYLVQCDAVDQQGNEFTVYLAFAVKNAHSRVPTLAWMAPFLRPDGSGRSFPDVNTVTACNFPSAAVPSGDPRNYAPLHEAYWAAIDSGGFGGNATQLQGFAISSATPTVGQALVYDSTPNWAPRNPGGSLGGTFLAATVLAIDGAAGTAPVNCANLTFADAAGSPVIGQASHASGASALMTVEPQQALSGNAGGLLLRGGKGSGAGGTVDVQVAATTSYALVGRFNASGFFPGGSWHSFQNGFCEIGAVGGVTVANAGTIRTVNNGSLQSFTGGAPGTPLSVLSWSGVAINLGSASNGGALGIFTSGSNALTLAPGGNLVIQSATKWFKGGSSHAGQTFSDQVDPQTTNATPTAVYTWPILQGTNNMRALITATRNDDGASFQSIEKFSVLYDGVSTYTNVFPAARIDGPDTVGTGSTIAAAFSRSSGNAVLTVTGNGGETWNYHIVFEVNVQP